MKVIYADTPIVNVSRPSIFLAGPTPRSTEVKSWRPEALRILETLNFSGHVLVPERGDWSALTDYTYQVEWEDIGLWNCTKIVFWIPRNMATLPGLTTNVEFGRFAREKRTMYGRPDSAEHVRYLDWYYHKYNGGNVYWDLDTMLKDAVADCLNL